MPRKADKYQEYAMLVLAVAGAAMMLAAMVAFVMSRGCRIE